MEIISLAGVPFRIDPVECIGDLGVDIRPDGVFRPGGIDFAGRDIFDVIRKGDGDILSARIRGAQMDGDGFGDIGFSRHEEASFRVIDPVARSHRRSVPHPRPPFRATG